MSFQPLGPVIRPQAPPPAPHVCEWKPAAASPDHVKCSCGRVQLRSLVSAVQVIFSDSAYEQLRQQGFVADSDAWAD